MSDPLKEHALHLLNSLGDRNVLPDIIKILERTHASGTSTSSIGARPFTPSSLQDALSRSFQVSVQTPIEGARRPHHLHRAGSPSIDSPSMQPSHPSDTLGNESAMDVLSLNARYGLDGHGGDGGLGTNPTLGISVGGDSSNGAVGPTQAGRRAAVSAMPMSADSIATFVPPVIEKKDEDTKEVRKVVATVHLFSSMDADEREVIVKAMDREEFDAGHDILTQDKPSVNRFYVIISGTVSIIKSGKQVATMESGQSFGELEMMYDAQELCAATVHAVTPVVCYFLDRQTFKNIVLKATLDKRNTYLQMLQNVPFLRGMSQYDKATLADVLQRGDYEPGDAIIKFAERGNWMHIIVDGEVKVMGRDSGRKVEIVRLGKGDPVGELEFLFNHPAVADVVAVTKVRTAKMNRKHFEMCMGPIADNLKLFLMEGNYEHYMKHADKSVLGEISAAEQKLKRTKVASAGGNVIASSSVDAKGEIVVLDDHTIVQDGSGGVAIGKKNGADGDDDDSDGVKDRNKYMYRFPLRAVHQQNTVIIGVREDGAILSWNDAAARMTNYSVEDTLGQSIYSLIKRQSDQKELHDLIHETSKWAGNTDGYFQKFGTNSNNNNNNKSNEQGRLPTVHCVFSRRDGLTSTQLAFTCVPGIIAQPKHIPEMILLVGSEQKQVIQDKDLDYGDWIVEQMRDTLGGYKGETCDKAAIQNLLNEYEQLRHRSRTIDKDQLHALNPRLLLGQVVSSLQHDAVERDNEVSTDFGPEVPEQLFCDTELLPEVLRVALHNCVKHNSGSRIKIHVNIVEDRSIEYLEIAFEDNGPGIDPGQIKAFEKPNIDPKSQYANSGLVKLKAAVARLGGTMSVSSVPNHTVVKFRIQYLPSEDDFLSAGNNFASSPSTTVAGRNGEMLGGVGEGATVMTSAASGDGNSGDAAAVHINRTYTTLVAEEHAVNRNALCSFLWNRKHAVVPAHNTADFLRLVDSCDIVIVDPEQKLIDSSVDIFTLLQRLERNKAVVVSGMKVSDETREAHRKAGFITLSKPYSPVATVAAIRKAEETVNKVKAEQEKVAAMRATFQRTNRGEWTKGALLGKGAFGDVYESIDVLTGGKMAVKMMRITKNQNKQDLINEIEVMCTLRHPNIIHYFYCEDVPEEGRINIFMEFANGGTLDGKLTKLNRPMTMQEMRPILVDIVEGIKYIHSRRFIHCDLKTANILFGHDGHGKIGDFGTARQLPEGAKLYNMAGTFQYMSPECMGADKEEGHGYDFSSDIWSIGCIALELATGKLPWTHLPCKGNGMPLIAYMTELTEEQGSPDLSNIFDAPPPVFEFIRACLDINPEKRPTAAALLDFALLRGGLEDDDAATAIKALAKAKLIHQLNQFVAFAEPLNGDLSDRDNNNNNYHGGAQKQQQQHGGSSANNNNANSNRRQSIYEKGFFDSDEDELPAPTGDEENSNNNNNHKHLSSSKRKHLSKPNDPKMTTQTPVGKAGAFFDSSDEEKEVKEDGDDDDKNRKSPTPKKKHEDTEKSPPASPSANTDHMIAENMNNNNDNSNQQQQQKQRSKTPEAAPKKKKEFWEDTSEEDDDDDDDDGNDNKKNGSDDDDADDGKGPSMTAVAAAAVSKTSSGAGGGGATGRTPSAPDEPKPAAFSPHPHRYNNNNNNSTGAASKETSGVLPALITNNAIGGETNTTSTTTNRPSSTEVRACSMAIHGKLLQLLSRVSDALNMGGEFTVVDPLQAQYQHAVSPMKERIDMASSQFAEEEGKPFVPNVTGLLRSHVDQLDKFLEQLELHNNKAAHQQHHQA